MERGWSEEEAWAEARARFGDVEAIRRECADIRRRRESRMRWRRAWDRLGQDLRYGWRTLTRRPGFSLVSLATLALGMGATAAVFGLVNTVLLRPVPVPDPGSVHWLVQGDRPALVSPPAVDAIRRDAVSLAGVGAVAASRAALVREDAPPRLLEGWRATPGLLEVAGRAMHAGRPFTEEDARPGADPVVILSHGTWVRDFAADPAVVGTSVGLGGTDHRVVGVLPDDWILAPESPDFMLPLVLTPGEWASAGGGYLRVVVRLAPGVTPEAARAEMARTVTEAGIAGADEVTEVGLRSVGALLGDPVRRPLFLLLGAVVVVLLIGCGNVANLLLAQGAGRRRELAVRNALGAGRGRVRSQLMVESLLLGGLGALLALPVAWAVLRTLVALAPADLPRLAGAGLDASTLAFTLALGVGTAFLFGLVPAIRGARGDLQSALKDGARTVGESRRDWLRSGLVTAEVALCLVLLVGAGLLMRSADALRRVDRGFSDGVLTGRIALPWDRYPSVADAIGTFEEIRDRMARVPGVTGVAFTSRAPLAGRNFGLPVTRTGEESRAATGDAPGALMRIVSPGYFDAMGVALSRGPGFRPTDDVAGGGAVVINQVLADALALGSDPIGARITAVGSDFRDPGSGAWRSWEIVGVVAATRDDGLRADPPPELYFLPRNIPPSPWDWIGRELMLVVRAGDRPETVAPELRRAVASVDPALPLHDLQTMDRRVADSLALDRMIRLLLLTLGGLGTLLAAGGIFGVVSVHVARRIPEMGVRVALGASGASVRDLVIRRTAIPVAAGVALGGTLALLGGGLLGHLLYGVSPRDPLSFAGACALVAAVGLGAAWFPALRAARVDPARALASD